MSPHRERGSLLVAVQPSGIDGAGHAGLPAAWLRRSSAEYPAVMTPRSVISLGLRDLAGAFMNGHERSPAKEPRRTARVDISS